LCGSIIEAAKTDLDDRPEPFLLIHHNTPRWSEAEPR
jgi:hypothetical protein